MKTQVLAQVEALSQELTALSSYLFDHPETGFKEKLASKAIVEFLQRHGFTTQLGYAGMETSFYAEKQGSGQGPTIAFLSEYDALAGIGHACGHNTIATASCGAAVALAEAEPDFPGKIVLLGTPAEEGNGGGKQKLVDAAVLQGIDCALMYHPMNTTDLRSRFLAVNAMDITFHGRAAHAAANPEDGINALEAVMLTFTNINALRQHLRSDCRVHGYIKNGGSAQNVIPDLTEAEIAVRAADSTTMHQLTAKVQNCAKAAALATGCTVEIQNRGLPYDDVLFNETLIGLFEKELQAQGVAIDSSEVLPGKGSSDIGNISQALPTYQLGLRIGDASPHTIEFAQLCQGESGGKAAIKAAKLLAGVGYELLHDPSLVQAAWAEFHKQKA